MDYGLADKVVLIRMYGAVQALQTERIVPDLS